LICTTALDDHAPRLHTCISDKIYFLFGLDGTIGNPDYDGDTSDKEDSTPLALSSTPAVASTAIAAAVSTAAMPSVGTTRSTAATASTAVTRSTATSATAGTPNVPSALQRLPSVSTLSFLPPQIWDVDWTPAVGRYEQMFSPELMAEVVYVLATDDVPTPPFEVRGKDAADLVVSFRKLLGQAAAWEDFTNILSPNRSFLL